MFLIVEQNINYKATHLFAKHSTAETLTISTRPYPLTGTFAAAEPLFNAVLLFVCNLFRRTQLEFLVPSKTQMLLCWNSWLNLWWLWSKISTYSPSLEAQCRSPSTNCKIWNLTLIGMYGRGRTSIFYWLFYYLGAPPWVFMASPYLTSNWYAFSF